MNWKQAAKRFRSIYALNAFIKCSQLKRRLVAIKRQYNQQTSQSGYHYVEADVLETFKNRHRKIQPNFKPVSNGNLRVFWVGACQSQDESGFLQSLKRIAKVTVFYNLEGGYGPLDSASTVGMSLTDLRTANDQALLKRVAEAQADGGLDILIGQMWAHLYSVEALQEVHRLGIPVINIAMDDRLPQQWATREGVRMGSVGLASGVDMVLTTSPETCAWYGVEDCPALFWPLASDPDIFSPEDCGTRDIDVLFIGNRYGIRGKIVDSLTKQGLSITCYGNGWANGYVNAEKNTALSKRAKIILGVGTVGHCQDIYTLKLRDFDALMTGALYITHRNPDLLKLFKEGTDIECYSTPAEAGEKIYYYLKHREERLQIGKSGKTVAVANHSWDVRLIDTFRRLGLLL